MCEVHSGVHGAQGTSHSGASEEDFTCCFNSAVPAGPLRHHSAARQADLLFYPSLTQRFYQKPDNFV